MENMPYSHMASLASLREDDTMDERGLTNALQNRPLASQVPSTVSPRRNLTNDQVPTSLHVTQSPVMKFASMVGTTFDPKM